jgi:crossover junction endodeoxyribonuclease RusA
MTATTRLVLPYPPSTNRYWRNYRGRMVRSEEANNYRAGIAGSHFWEGSLLFGGPVAVTLDVYRPRKSGDLDNRIKVVLDALQGLAYVNDDQIVSIIAHRHDDKHNPRVEVTIEAVSVPPL